MSHPNTKPSVLTFTGFRDLWFGNLISQFGDVLHFIVFLWWAGEIAGPVGVAIVMSCSAATYFVLSLFAGAIADRIDRRKILLLSDLFCGFAVAGLVVLAAFTVQPPLWVLCVFTIVLKATYSFQIPARNAAVPRLVPEDRLLEANSLNMAAQTGMPLAGNALGAVVLGAIFKVSASMAYMFTFALNSLTFFASAIFMARLPRIEPERSKNEQSAFRDAVDGVKFLFGSAALKACVGLFLAFEFFMAPFMPAYVEAAQTTFKNGYQIPFVTVTGPALLALLETGFFLGFVIGSWVVYKRTIKRVGTTFAFFVALASLMIAPMGYVDNVPAFWLLNFLCGVLFPFGIIPLQTYVQLETPDAYRGRVNAAMGTIAVAAGPIGAVTGGVLLKVTGLEGTFLFMGVGLAAASVLALAIPVFRTATLNPKPVEAVPSVVEEEEPSVAV